MALEAIETWRYFGSTKELALSALRSDYLGPQWTSSPSNARLEVLLRDAVQTFHAATGRFFLKRNGTLDIDGTGKRRLELPLPVVSTAQGGTGVTAVTVGEGDNATEIDVDDLRINDGVGFAGFDDPRQDPYIELTGQSGASLSSLFPTAKWSRGTRNVHVTADWGYLEEDGTTPGLILKAIARLVEILSPYEGDADAQEDKRRHFIAQENTHGRGYMVAQIGMSGGLTGDRIVDQIIAKYKRPPFVGVASVDEIGGLVFRMV